MSNAIDSVQIELVRAVQVAIKLIRRPVPRVVANNVLREILVSLPPLSSARLSEELLPPQLVPTVSNTIKVENVCQWFMAPASSSHRRER